MKAFKLNAKRSLLPSAISAAMVCAPAYSNDQSAEDAPSQSLETVVVVGQATNVLITPEKMEYYQAQDLSDVFRVTPSVSVGGSLGIAQKIYVRGLEDNYVNVTVDGAPQTSTLYHHIGRVSIAPDLLKQVEVQAGAGEATSGAGAIGGAIRFETKDVNDLLAKDERFGGKVQGTAMTYGEGGNVSLYGRLSDDWGVLGYYNLTKRDDFKDGNGDIVRGTASDQELGFIKLSGDISDNQHLSLSYEDRREEADFGSRPNWHVQPDDLLYASKATRKTGVANYQFEQSSALNLEASLYSTESTFRGGRFDWLTEISTWGLDLRNTSEVGDHRFTYGVDYRDDQVDSGDPLYAQEVGDVLGVYAQGHSQITSNLLLSYGARFDEYDFSQVVLEGDSGEPAKFNDSDVSFNAGLLYDLTDAWSLGLGYAEAFRGKEVGDGFTIDQPQLGSPLAEGLKGESVSNVEASVEYKGERLNFKAAVFDSVIDDALFSRLYSGGFYDNVGEVNNRGYELELAYQWTDVGIYAGYTDVDSIFEPKSGYYSQDFGTIHLNGYEFAGLGNSRGDSFNLGLDYTPIDTVRTGLNISYVESLTYDTLHQDFDDGWLPSLYSLKKDGYTTVDIYAEWEPVNGLIFNLAVINLTDELYRDHSSVGDYSEVPGYDLVVGPWEAGRDIRFTASYQF